MLKSFKRSSILINNASNSYLFFSSLSKLVASSGICSRREAEKWILQGRVEVNGSICRCPSFPITDSDYQNQSATNEIIVDGIKLRSGYTVRRPRLWAINKLRGEIVTESNSDKSRPVLMDRFFKFLPNSNNEITRESLKPVNRLEYDTEGLCLISNNGDLARMLSTDLDRYPRHYRIRVNGLITDEKLRGLRTGLYIDGVKYKPMEVTIQKTSDTITWLHLVSRENQNRVIHNSFKKLYLNISRLICTGIGPFKVSEWTSPMVELKLTPEVSAAYHQLQYSKVINTKSKVVGNYDMGVGI